MEPMRDIMKNDSISTVGTDREACPKNWYVAHVRSCCEKKVAQKLQALGVETYVPVQIELHQWSDRKKKVEVILIPMMVFIHIEPKRLSEIKQLSFIYGLLRAPGNKDAAVIPSVQIDNLKFMVEYCNGNVVFTPQDFNRGDSVEICRGSLKGLTGYVRGESKGKTKIGVVIDFLGCATVEVSKSDIKSVSINK